MLLGQRVSKTCFCSRLVAGLLNYMLKSKGTLTLKYEL